MDGESLKPVVIGAVFAAVHLIGPRVAAHRRRLEPHFSSLAGGFAAAFVFLELLPSIDDYHAVIGRRIYGIILVGFAAFYGVECIAQRRLTNVPTAHTDYFIGMVMAFLYNLLLAIGMCNELPETMHLTVLFAILIGCHLLSTDLALIEEHGQQFSRYGRFTLILAIAIGLTIGALGDPHQMATDVVAAAVVGAVLYRVMRRELPEFSHAHYRSFALGAFFFAAIHVLLASR